MNVEPEEILLQHIVIKVLIVMILPGVVQNMQLKRKMQFEVTQSKLQVKNQKIKILENI
jgi:hypothetical protein